MTIPRFSLSTGSPLPTIVENLRVNGTRPRVQRLVGLRLSSLYRADPAETERLLGAAIERVRTMGATAVVMEGVETGPDGRLAAWFPTTHLPVRADVYLRVRVAVSDARRRARVRPDPGRRRSRGHWQRRGHDGALPRLRHLHLGGRAAVQGHAARLPRAATRAPASGGTRRQRRNAIDAATISPNGAPRLRLFQSRRRQAAGPAARAS